MWDIKWLHANIESIMTSVIIMTYKSMLSPPHFSFHSKDLKRSKWKQMSYFWVNYSFNTYRWTLSRNPLPFSHTHTHVIETQVRKCWFVLHDPQTVWLYPERAMQSLKYEVYELFPLKPLHREYQNTGLWFSRNREVHCIF